MLQISDSEIARTEKLLLPPGCTFNDERRAFIRCMESRDVVACPGSGKTTALLAKLLIMAAKMPFEGNRGICVLTHTNVAIDEIKKRAGSAADMLFRHPNFFGTIQSFVNRFLAIPAYRLRFKKPVQSIDNGPFFAAVEGRYRTDYRLQPWLEPRGGIATLGSYWFKPADLSIGKNLDDDIPKLGRDTPTYKKIEAHRRSILKSGVLSYNDAYSLGLHYLHYYPQVAEALRERFAYVFIDEMQDTDDHQMRILNNLFCHDRVCLQRLGDPNQAIFHSEVKKGMLWSPTNDALPFSDSLRYGASIAKVLNTVRVDCELTLRPNPARDSLAPHMFIFEKGAEGAVLPAFARLIRECKLHELDSSTFKAVGWVGKDKTEEGKLCIRHYLPNYHKSLQGQPEHFQTLLSYLHAAHAVQQKEPEAAEHVASHILNAITHALRLASIKYPKTSRPFTKATLLRYLKEGNEELHSILRETLSDWALRFRRDQVEVDSLRDEIAVFIRKQMVKAANENAAVKEFLDSSEVDFQLSHPRDEPNVFVSAHGDRIEVGTVHSVKGETHTATLYLETLTHELNSKKLLPFCLGNYPAKEAKLSRHRENLKIAHVAFSRPTHLLAFACCDEHVTGLEEKLRGRGWDVRKVGLKPQTREVL
jgi:superfamily I DNA/RNA helicase